MNFHIYFFLKKDKPDRNNTLPIYCRIRLGANDRTDYCTKIRIHQQLWLDKPIPNKDGTLRYIKGTSKLISAYNKKLNILIAKVLERYNELFKNNEPMTVQEVKKALTGDMNKKTISQLFEEVAKTKRTKSTKTTFEIRCRKILAFVEYHYKMQLPVDALTHPKYRAFPVRFEAWLDLEGRAKNYKLALFSTLNNSYEHAKKLGYVEKNPFTGYKINNNGKTEGILSLNFSELAKFKGVHLKDSELQKTQDLFLFQAYTGLSYIDLKQVSKKHLTKGIDHKNWLIKSRQKSTGVSKIPLIDDAQELLDKYIKEDQEGFFDVPSPKNYNDNIKEIATKAGITKHLTSHSARHSCATLLLEIGVPIQTISMILGHTNTTTTKHYAKVTDPLISREFEKLNKKLGS